MRRAFVRFAWLGAALLMLALGGAWWRVGRADQFVSYRADVRRQHVALYWRTEHGQPLRSLGGLRAWLAGQGRRLRFATNGGMYRAGNVPVGLLVLAGRQLVPLDTATTGHGNFYLQPNGVFYLSPEGRAGVCRTQDFGRVGRVLYATQSGPMLVIEGQLHPAFRAGSANRHVRNGVGVLPDGRVLLVMSKEPVSFYDFARYFQQQGCRNALYLDGFVSRTYLPAQGWVQTDGDFGVMIGVTDR
ncbi:phosphodiester glycosidase family protein [Hymenobacter latericus]|uniref:phosphodiester glycosidase family protein n=1 Tax=Hymenobacter sp. YIM 151858-1 TaxID=2987688 RepID=UPI0022268AEC|nr:phosphodiester glycosidase family protein [Hymenobacter sp. YIM 151858-1]UYZ60038.1 phosphodiester glycosidase family protein [Hymenobacter sp. YIM 151858-1]